MHSYFPHRVWETGFMLGAVMFAWEHDAWSMAILAVGALAYVWYPFGADSSGGAES